jgi:hypothetical protein
MTFFPENNLELDIAIPTDDGRWVSEKHERIARIIQDYNPDLHLAYIPPDKRDPNDVPFAVIHTPQGKPSYIVFTANECDERILERLWETDSAKQGDILSKIDAHNAAVEAIRMKKELDEAEERQDLISHIVRSPLNVYKHNGVEFRDSPR